MRLHTSLLSSLCDHVHACAHRSVTIEGVNTRESLVYVTIFHATSGLRHYISQTHTLANTHTGTHTHIWYHSYFVYSHAALEHWRLPPLWQFSLVSV